MVFMRKWTKRKAVLVLSAVLIITFFAFFNTSTRYGRWLFWQDMDLGDIDRFAFRMVENDPDNRSAFSETRESGFALDIVSKFRIENESFEEFAESHESTALIVVHDGSVLVEKYFRGHQRETLQSSVSCTKSIISLLVGIAISEGRIGSVDDPITKYVTGLNDEFENVSIRHLMTMTSGISDTDEKFFDAVPKPWSDEVCGYYDPNLRQLSRSFQLDHMPGEHFEYHDFNPVLIGMLLENATGQNISQYLSEKIWKPGGMGFPAKWSMDSYRNQFELPAAGLHGTAIDFARLGAMIINSKQKVIPESWIKNSVQDQVASELLQKNLTRSAQIAEDKGAQELARHIRSLRYGYYWWGIERNGRYDFYANGRFGQFIYVSPKARLVIVRHGVGHGGLNDWYFGNHFFNLATELIDAKRLKELENN